jgi:hypothetical protein
MPRRGFSMGEPAKAGRDQDAPSFKQPPSGVFATGAPLAQ